MKRSLSYTDLDGHPNGAAIEFENPLHLDFARTHKELNEKQNDKNAKFEYEMLEGIDDFILSFDVGWDNDFDLPSENLVQSGQIQSELTLNGKN